MLNSKLTSSKPILIILHGLFGSSDNWQNLAKRFAADATVFALDLRNHGNSAHKNSMSYKEMAGDLAAFLDAHGIPKAHVLGHSMGGKVAMQFASDFPDRIEKLLVADIAPKAYQPHFQNFIDVMLAVDFSNVKTRKDVDSQLQTAVPELGVRQFLLKNVKRNESGKFSWKLNLEAIQKNYESLINSIHLKNEIDCNTLFIRGGNSIYIEDADIPALMARFPKSAVETINGAGHWLHAEKPDEFFAISQSFLIR
jgi:pimeloyl-ACP methyl ester carboxylesterase